MQAGRSEDIGRWLKFGKLERFVGYDLTISTANTWNHVNNKTHGETNEL
jgi:hypothetical protein